MEATDKKALLTAQQKKISLFFPSETIQEESGTKYLEC